MSDETELVRFGGEVFRVRKADIEEGRRRYVRESKRANAGRSFNEIMDDASDDSIQAPVSDHHASKVADLLVEAGSHPDRAAALHHVLHSAGGQALLARMKKKDEPMDRIEGLTNAMKGGGLEKFCKALIDNDSEGVSEYDLVAAATKFAADTNPGVPADVAFAKLYESDVALRKAVSVAKSASDTTYRPAVTEARVTPANFAPVVVSGQDAYDNVLDPQAALDEIATLACKLYPFLPRNQAFAKVFEDPAYAALAARAHQRPVATTSFAFPH